MNLRREVIGNVFTGLTFICFNDKLFSKNNH